MVVMGIMLVLGVGVATLLVRQIRESGVSEKTAVAFYVKETALDGFSVLDTWTDITWSGAEEKLEYKVTENEGEYDVAVRIDDDNYYFFGKEDEGGGSSGGDNGGGSEEARRSFYYSNPNGWGSVEMMYGFFDEKGTNVSGWQTVAMTPSEYTGWEVYEFPTEIDSEVEEIRLVFGEEGADILDYTYYLYKNEGAEGRFNHSGRDNSTPPYDKMFSIFE
jgi:type II secretory pathway pseudopilin PulG